MRGQVRPPGGEKNYHVLYALIGGATTEERRELGLLEEELKGLAEKYEEAKALQDALLENDRQEAEIRHAFASFGGRAD